jgi:hypothetical protein
MSTRDVLTKLDWYHKQFTAIRRDEALTEAGRERQYNNLSQSYELYGFTAHKEFDMAWRQLRGEFDTLSAKRRAAAQSHEDAWSYDRLNYYKEQARADISRAASLSELEKHLRGIVDSGSREQARAYLEQSNAVMLRFRGQSGLGSFAAWMDREASKLTRPPEFDKLDKQEHELIMRAVKLRDETTTAANMLPQSGVGYLLRDVHIGMRVDSASGKYYYDVAFGSPESITAPAAPAAPATAAA